MSGIPNRAGLYLIRNEAGSVLYIGITAGLKVRIQHHIDEGDIPNTYSIQIRRTKTLEDAEKLEMGYIRRYLPKYNIIKNR